jgi:hypothetical protein
LWSKFLAGVVETGGSMMVSKTEQKIGRGKLPVSTSEEKKFYSNASFYLNNAFGWPF